MSTSVISRANAAPLRGRDGPGHRNGGPDIVAEFPISDFESFIVTLDRRRNGRRTAALVRVKRTDTGLRVLNAFEFGTNRILAISSLIDELARAIAGSGARP
jgi:hypothetical protein